jgi:hypothetical protein
MKWYYGCNSPSERRKRACGDEERGSAKKQLLIFKLLFFFVAESCLRNGGRHDRLEQPNGTKGTTVVRPLNCP